MSRKIEKLFRSPYAVPNCLQTTDEGLWIVDQITDRVALVDPVTPVDHYGVNKWLREIATESSNTSGLSYGDGALWLGANGPGTLWRPIRSTDAHEGEIFMVDPATGLATVNLVDASRAPAPLVPLETSATCGQSFELFTLDTRRALYYCLDLSTGAASLRSGGLDGVVRTLSTGDAGDFQHYGLSGTRLVYADDLVITGPLWLEWSVSLKVTDAARDDAPVLVVPEAMANYFVTPDRRTLVYSSTTAAGGPGLYALPVH